MGEVRSTQLLPEYNDQVQQIDRKLTTIKDYLWKLEILSILCQN